MSKPEMVGWAAIFVGITLFLFWGLAVAVEEVALAFGEAIEGMMEWVRIEFS